MLMLSSYIFTVWMAFFDCQYLGFIKDVKYEDER